MLIKRPLSHCSLKEYTDEDYDAFACTENRPYSQVVMCSGDPTVIVG